MTLQSIQPLSRCDLVSPAAVAGILAFAGLPLYIHTPIFYAEEMSISFAVLGFVLLMARAVDSFQDPLLGRLADRLPSHRKLWSICAGLCLACGIAILFAPPSWGEPLPRLIVGLIAAFSGFSALQIVLYDHGLAQAEISGGGYTRISLWREVGGLVGICFAAATPALLGSIFGNSLGYTGYSIILFLFVFLVLAMMHHQWLSSQNDRFDIGFVGALRVKGVKPILAFGFVNALPTAVTSTLFLFYVSDVIEAESHAGPLLILFFAAAAMAATLWGRLANYLGRKVTLTIGMMLSIPAFVGAWFLGSGDILPFYVIVLASGAALGADMTLAPAILASRIRGGGARVFSIWTFLQKTALATAAGVTLPLLAFAGYDLGTSNQSGQTALSTAYAVVPCGLKLISITVLWKYVEETRS